ncbi:MAG: ABC transporter substrate-binding protein [Desulfopila sp.]|jgi:NitT/TauT family transport system substrate-binding protein|nr:ABC transporter substrate-binding protein [Desulfopila sp.]
MKRATIWLAVAAVSVLMLAQSGGAAEKSQPEKLTTLTVAELRSEFWLPAYLAETLGFYKEEGLNVRFITTKDGPVAFQGMHAGSADLTMLSTEPVLRAQAKGLESIIFMALLTNKPYMFVGSPAIKDVKQLKGKTIFAGAPGSAPHSFALSILEKAGMKDTDVNWAQMEYGASLAALEKGHIEASYIRSTAKKEIAAVGANILVDVSDPVQHEKIYGTSRYESTIVTGTKKFVRENPETIQKFANAVVRAMIWLNENSNEAAAEKAMPMFPAGNMGAESIGFLRPSLSVDGLITPEGHQTIVSFCLAEGIIDRDIPYGEINDMSFVQKAYEKYK